MARTWNWFTDVLFDVTVMVGLFLHWLTVGLIVDAASADQTGREVASLWLALSSIAVSAWRLYVSFSQLGTPPSRTAPETVVGVFSEIVAISETFGVCFMAARTWSLPSSDPFHQNDFLHNTANSVFEMALVQAGVGWAAAAPYTLLERLVAWAAAYIGGVLVMNFYLLSIALGQRGWWNLPPGQGEFVGLSHSAAGWKFSTIARG